MTYISNVVLMAGHLQFDCSMIDLLYDGIGR